jgi:hypothetical protein
VCPANRKQRAKLQKYSCKNFSNDKNVSISMITTFPLVNYEDTCLGVLHQLLEISEGVGHAHLALSLDDDRRRPPFKKNTSRKCFYEALRPNS